MSPDEKALRDMIAAWIRASDADDFEALSAMVAPDAVFLAPARAPVEGREAWAVSRDRAMPGVESRCEVQQVEVYGEAGHAWFSVKIRVPASEGVPEVRVEGHNLSLYRRGGDGRWLLAREARMLAPGR